MTFSNDILKKIIGFGSNGYSIHRIAKELNLTSDELRDKRAKDAKLDDALNRAEYNCEQYLIDTIEKKSIGISSPVQRDVYNRLIQKHDKNTDNKITIEEV